MKQFILMADIIGSSEKEPGTLMESFKSAVNVMNKRFSEHLHSPLTITLGDEFQGIVDSLDTGIGIIFALDEYILQSPQPYGLRFVLLLGNVETPLNRQVAHGMLGEGLTRARKELERMKKNDREILVEGIGDKEKLLLALDLYRALYNDWPPKDRRIAYDFLMVNDYKKVAELHHRDNSSMWRKERSLKMREFGKARKLIKLLINE